MDKHLKGVVVCVAGNLGHDAGHDQWTDTNIKRWLDARGGEHVDEMCKSVTHLLCSKAAFKAKKDKVRYAQRNKCKIVTYEWLDDAILLFDQLKRKASTNLYHPGKRRPEKEILALYRKRSKGIRKVHADAGDSGPGRKEGDGNATKIDDEYPAVLKKSQRSNAEPHEKEEQNSTTSEGDVRNAAGIPHVQVDHRLYQILKDPTDGFPYQVEVSCPDVDGNPRGKRWILQLFESKSTPKFYRFGPIHFERGGDGYSCGRGSAAARPKDPAMEEFADFFAKKTGIRWEERLVKASEQHKGQGFRYYPPAPGEPVGYIHPKYLPGEAEDTKCQGQADSNSLARNSWKQASSLKRKRGDLVDSQPVKAAKVAHKKTAAFDDINKCEQHQGSSFVKYPNKNEAYNSRDVTGFDHE